MNFIKTPIDGLLIIEPTVFEDDRGFFFESYNEKTFQQNGITNHFVQDNQSRSTYGVIRGLHCQNGEHAQAKLVRALQGRILDIAIDIRDGSPTFGRHVAVELSDQNKRQLFIPRGFLHGFSVLSDTAICFYKCDNFYHKDAEAGVRYDDPLLNLDWQIPTDKINVSDKDNLLKGLNDVARYRM